MKNPDPPQRLEPPTLGQFREFVRKIISVPKSEVDKKEADYRKERTRKKQKRLSFSGSS